MFDDLILDNQPEIQVEEPQVEQTQAAQEQLKYQENNFRQLREAKEKATRERDDAMAMLQAMMKNQQQPKAPEPEPEVDLSSYPELEPFFRKVQHMEKEFNQYKQQSTTTLAETRLKAQYPDFDSVVSADNVETFARQYPEMAKTIDSSTDLYSKAVTAYNMIKQFGVYQPQNYNAEKMAATVNTNKPKPLASIGAQMGDSPMSKANAFANGLTKELKAELWNQMKESRKRV